MKTFTRIAVAFTLAFATTIPLSFIVTGLGGRFGYSELGRTMPFLIGGIWWILGRHPYFKRQ